MMNFLNLLAQTEDAGDGLIPPPPRTDHEGSYWFPENASTFANDVDSLFMLIFWVSLVFFAAIVGAMVYFVLKYRERPGHKVEKSPSHNTALEIAWSVLPGFLLVWFFVDGANGWFKQRIIPGDAEQIQVVGKQFSWEFYYPNGDVTTDLHLVKNQPVEFVMESRDVLHSFFIPAFRQKQDLVPGRFTYTWVHPTKEGVFRLYCSEYCGDGHSLMKTNVKVHASHADRDAATFYNWEDGKPVDNGKRIFMLKCAGCHNPTEVKKTGPGLANIWGKERDFGGGDKLTVDENYFTESIRNPNARIVSGFSKPSQMTVFSEADISNEEMAWLRAYIRSLSGLGPQAEPDAEAEEGGSNEETPADENENADGPTAEEQPAGQEG